MAKIKFSALIQDVRGSIGNGVFSNLRGTSYLRRKPKTVANPQTPTQKLVRNTLVSLTRRWYGVLTADQRAGWEEIAALQTTAAKNEKQTGVKGLMKTRKAPASGINAYVGINAVLATQGQTLLDDAPIGIDAPIAPTGLTATYSGTPVPTITLEWDEPAGYPVGTNIFVWAKSSRFFRAARLVTAVSIGTKTLDITQMKGKGGKMIGICADNYFFQIQAETPAGLKSPGSAIVSLNIPTI